MTEKLVILLNGPSSAGKSTLAAEIRKRLEKAGERSAVISVDDYMKTDPKETVYEDDIFEIMPDMCRDAERALAALLVVGRKKKDDEEPEENEEK